MGISEKICEALVLRCLKHWKFQAKVLEHVICFRLFYVAGASPGIVSCQEPWVLDNMIYQIKYIIYANWDTHIKKCKHSLL